MVWSPENNLIVLYHGYGHAERQRNVGGVRGGWHTATYVSMYVHYTERNTMQQFNCQLDGVFICWSKASRAKTNPHKKTQHWLNERLSISTSIDDEGVCMPVGNLKVWRIETPFPGLPSDHISSDDLPPGGRGKKVGVNVGCEFSFATPLILEPWPSTAESTRLMQGKHLPQWVGLNVGPLFR